ncbi:MAG: HPr family phosphocarrier protein [Exilispira sp.]|jgi:phosphotransferase system HPr (HPr) family protein|nr:HPr family phosphocarrier protein [Exilispira sp.]
MKEKSVTIKLDDGIHARPAAILVQKASSYENTTIKIRRDNVEIDAKSIMSIMMLALTYGSQITIIADGDEEDIAINEIANLIENNFQI